MTTPPQFVATRHGDLAYLTLGAGPPFVLLHGNTMTAASQERLAQRFANQFAVYSVDLLGHGGSARPAALFSLAYFTMQGEALADALAALFPQQAVPVFGMSAGGVSALNAACLVPERMAALILDSVFAFIGAETVAAHRESKETRAPTWETYLRKQHGADWWPQLDAGLLEAVTALEAAGTPLVPCLANIRLPTLIFQGGNDPFGTPIHGETIHAAIPGSRLIFLEDGEHIYCWRNPAAFRSTVGAFLDELGYGR